MGRKLGTQKKDTILKNMDRMSANHHPVKELDPEMTEIQESFNKAKAVAERKKCTEGYERKKLLLDGAYTELKHAQDALIIKINKS